jgi:hypothetical protein
MSPFETMIESVRKSAHAIKIANEVKTEDDEDATPTKKRKRTGGQSPAAGRARRRR